MNDLLEKSARLRDVTESDQHLHKNLESIHEQTKKLNLKLSRMQQVESTKGDYFLAGRGFNVEQFKRSLNTISIKPTFEPYEPLAETDIEGFLKHEHNMIILTAIEEAKKKTSNHFYKQYEEYMDFDWRNAKNDLSKMLDKVGLSYESAPIDEYTISSSVRPQTVSNLGILDLPQTPGRRGRSNMDSKMIGYSSVVYEFNRHQVSSSDHFPLIQRFLECAEDVDDNLTRRRDVVDAWKLLGCIVDEEKFIRNGSIPNYRQDYNKHVPEFINNGRSYLEKQYAQFLAERVSRFEVKNKPSNREIIEKFVFTEIKRSLVNDQSALPWALIFYSLRCGFWQEAKEFAAQNAQVIPNTIITLLSNYESQKFDRGTLRKECIELSENANKYKHAVYSVLSQQTKPSKAAKDIVNATIEDYMWYQLSTIGPEFKLSDLQTTITQSRSRFVQKSKPSLLYFKLLMLSLQFEVAINHLCSKDIEGYQVEAVHFAIGMNYYGILAQPDSAEAPLLSVESSSPKLNFAFLIKDYVRIFAHTNPRDTVCYLSLIQPTKTKLQYIQDLILESNDTTVLLGTLDKRGCLEEFLDESEFQIVLQKAATEYDKMGKFATAVELYFKAEQSKSMQEKTKSPDFLRRIISLMNRELSQVLVAGENRKEVVELARTVQAKFKKEKLHLKIKEETDKKLLETFQISLSLTDFFDLFYAKKYNDAIKAVLLLNILPSDNSRDNIMDRVHKMKLLEDSIKRRISDIILATMNALFFLYKQEASKKEVQKNIRNMSTALLTFAGYIQIYMPANAYAQILKLDAAMR